jgi:hypothetical protein
LYQPPVDAGSPHAYPALIAGQTSDRVRLRTGRDGHPGIEGGTVARAKQTARSEARRRYRQASTTTTDGEAELSASTPQPNVLSGKPAPRQTDRPNPATGRPGFMSAVRGAYHPAHIREDLRALPRLLTHWSFLVSAVLVLGGAAGKLILPNYTGTEFAWQLLALPGSALAPQLVAGFFAPRGSYLLGLIIGLEQGVVFTILASSIATQLGTPIPSDQVGNLLILSFITGPISGTLFAAAAAWYRRFLALSSPRRAAPAKGGSGRTPARGNAPRRSGR